MQLSKQWQKEVDSYTSVLCDVCFSHYRVPMRKYGDTCGDLSDPLYDTPCPGTCQGPLHWMTVEKDLGVDMSDPQVCAHVAQVFRKCAEEDRDHRR